MTEENQPGQLFHQPNWTVHGDVNMAGRDFYQNIVNNSTDAEVVTKLFEGLRSQLDNIPADDRPLVAPIIDDAEQKVTAIQEGDESEEAQSALEKRLRSLIAMAPDIGEVFVTTLANPVAGIAMVVSKIAAKVAGEKNKTAAEGAG
jgi:hypothetical protein